MSEEMEIFRAKDDFPIVFQISKKLDKIQKESFEIKVIRKLGIIIRIFRTFF